MSCHLLDSSCPELLHRVVTYACWSYSTRDLTTQQPGLGSPRASTAGQKKLNAGDVRWCVQSHVDGEWGLSQSRCLPFTLELCYPLQHLRLRFLQAHNKEQVSHGVVPAGVSVDPVRPPLNVASETSPWFITGALCFSHTFAVKPDDRSSVPDPQGERREPTPTRFP